MPQQVVVIHGGDSFVTYEKYLKDLRDKEITLEKLQQRDWKSTLGEKLGADFAVYSPRMPNAQNAKYSEWRLWFDKIVPLLSDDVILIGHSLGGLFLAKYLSEETFPQKIRATFLIAAPYSTPTHEPIGDFLLPDTLRKLEQQGGKIFLYHSQDDPVVPFTHIKKYQQFLSSAQLRTFTDRQHFNQAELAEIMLDFQVLRKRSKTN